MLLTVVACRVHCARPVRTQEGATSADTVEMDAVDRKRVQEDLQSNLGFQCVPAPFECPRIGTLHALAVT